MTSVFFDSTLNDDARRSHLFKGEIFVYAPCASAIALCEFARELLKEAFHPYDPRTAQHELSVEEYAAILSKVKPLFINHPTSKKYVQGVLKDLGCDVTKTYFDVPRMRSATSDGYLTSGIAFAFHPHRDTWYSATLNQLNWWFPIYDVEPDNVMAFHPRYWDQAVKNSSSCYNYYQWNQNSRQSAVKHIKKDTRVQPYPEEPVEIDPQIRVVSKPGGVTIFSAAQLHSTVPNTSGYTRFSIDFRTVHLDDLIAKQGAPNVDSSCTGHPLRDFLRADDLSNVPDDVIALYDDGTEKDGVLVYQPPELTTA
ncbi:MULTISPECIES: hypothetical protein [unclassified Leptolyngbya]|uniref:hypothetical protein n=1 Tax=unclassified Leptolyngbya TaxID=2650499 RepID=UPI0016884125|nr:MULTISPECIES: hypothetical protein [unclassified Leptolyngbya]MBD1909875.1 hypothetical protein [Leptolyngbya sp. FACHB-8]MBD2156971.1 hypothetical protein [Leptolyngbya sp. FACHB-16]